MPASQNDINVAQIEFGELVTKYGIDRVLGVLKSPGAFNDAYNIQQDQLRGIVDSGRPLTEADIDRISVVRDREWNDMPGTYVLRAEAQKLEAKYLQQEFDELKRQREPKCGTLIEETITPVPAGPHAVSTRHSTPIHPQRPANLPEHVQVPNINCTGACDIKIENATPHSTPANQLPQTAATPARP